MPGWSKDHGLLPDWLVVAAILLLGTAVYLPGLSGDFVFDDHTNIVENRELRPQALSLGALMSAALSSDSGPLRRPLASLSFLANFELFGLYPLSFKITNLVIHLLNGWLVFCVLRALLGRLLPQPRDAGAIAAVTAVLWTVHPLNLTGVLYIVQRMTSLSATFCLLAILCYLRARAVTLDRRQALAPGWWLGVIACGSLGLASKENAILLPYLLVLVEWGVFGYRAAPVLRWLTGIGLAGTAVGVYLLFGPLDHFANSFRARPFSAGERALTELRVLVFYLRQLLLPNPTDMALLHADWTVSKSWTVPWTTAAAAAFWGGLTVTAVLLRRSFPLVLLGIGWFLIGHLLESTALPLDLVYEHRNYLPSVGILVLAVWLVFVAMRTQPTARRLMLGGILLACSTMTAYRAWQWSDPFTLALTEARHNPTSARARYEYGRRNFQLYLVDRDPALLAKTRRELRAAVEFGHEDFHPLVALVNTYVMSREPVPEPLMRELETELREQPPSARRLEAVYVAMRCQMTGACPRVPRVVMRALGAALENQRLTPRFKAKLLEWLAIYYTNVMGDLPAARRIMEEAVQTLPDNWLYRLRLFEVTIVQKDGQAAREVLARLEPEVTPWIRIKEPGLAARFDRLRAQLATLPPTRP